MSDPFPALRARIRAGLLAAAEEARDIYREEASRKQYPPTRSVEGEYPARESGQGVENIEAAIHPDENEMVSKFGLYGRNSPLPARPRFPGDQRPPGAEHMLELEIWMEREGMEATVVQNTARIAEAFKRGARSAGAPG